MAQLLLSQMEGNENKMLEQMNRSIVQMLTQNEISKNKMDNLEKKCKNSLIMISILVAFISILSYTVYDCTNDINQLKLDIVRLDTKINEIQLTPGPTGKDGKNGKDGNDGKNGNDGKDGKDGNNISKQHIDDLHKLTLNANEFSMAKRGELLGGDGWIELGNFRIGNFDNAHFSVCNIKTKTTIIVFRHDGNVFYGPRKDIDLTHRPYVKGLKNVLFGNGYIQFGDDWRMGIVEHDHLSISHSSRQTAMIWRSDGTQYQGPRSDWNQYWDRDNWSIGTYLVQSEDTKYVQWIQFGNNFRMGQFDQNHFSISSLHSYTDYGITDGLQKTVVIYRNDGTVHSGPRNDFGLWTNKDQQKIFPLQ